MHTLLGPIRSFAVEEDGTLVVEYALIIAVVAISLVIALGGMSNGSFSTLIGRLNNCLTSSACI